MAIGKLAGLDDTQLLDAVRGLVAQKGTNDAVLVAHLAEVEERRLHLLGASNSMFDYCLRRLGLSESEAFHRITAARLMRRFPAIFELLANRRLTLSALCLLRDFLTPDSADALLAAACSKTKREVELLLATRFPAEKAPPSIRKLPAQRVIAASERPTSAVPSAVPSTKTERPTGEGQVPPPASPIYRVRFDASADLKAKLDRARELSSHANPSGDLAITVERALDLLIADLERRHFAQTKRAPREARAKKTVSKNAGPGPKLSATDRKRARIESSVRRALTARDAGQCSFVAPDGCRCGTRAFLQIHHERPWALGGTDDQTNLRWVCAAHNRFFAELDFGRSAIELRSRPPTR